MPGSERNPELYNSLKKLSANYKIQNAIVGKDLTKAEIETLVNLRSYDAHLG
jgi:hypothetical protein